MVRQRSAKPSFAGSTPAVASNLRIPVPPDFSFVATVESHGWYALAPFRWSAEEGILRRKESIDGRAMDLAISFRRRAIEVRGSADENVRDRIRRMFQLHVELGDFHKSHRWASKNRFGRLLCGSTLFEDAVKIIATTNTMWRQTVRMTELLVQKCGNEGAFPEPADVARFSVDELQRDCRLGYRAKSIHALASGIVSGAIDLAAISDPSQSTEGLFSSYRTLPGIGPYGAAHLLAMDGRHDFIAVDTEFRRFVRDRYHGGRRVADATMLRRYNKWGRWKYLAYWTELWRSVAAPLQPAHKDK